MLIENRMDFINSYVLMNHFQNNKFRIFNDSIIEKILSKEEYDILAKDEKTNKYLNNYLLPVILGRNKFCEKSLENAIKTGVKQYLIFASGLDTFAYRNLYLLDNIAVFEIDTKEMITEKKKRLVKAKINYSKVNYIKCNLLEECEAFKTINKSKYKNVKLSFCNLNGLSYDKTSREFNRLIKDVSKLIKSGSSIMFDYPNEECELNNIKSKHSYEEIEKICSDNGLLIYEHLNNQEMTNTYFSSFNILHPSSKIIAPNGISYCLAVKK